MDSKLDPRSKRENELFALWRSTSGDTRAQYESELLKLLRLHAARLCWTRLHEVDGDIVQEALAKVIEGADGFRGESGFSTWFHRIVTNLITDKIREIIRAKGELPSDELDDMPAVGSSPLEGLAIEQALGRLDDDSQIILRGSWMGMNDKEIATILGISPGAVRTRLSRLRKELGTETGF